MRLKLADYLQDERLIWASDGQGLRDRWTWGRRLLTDPDARLWSNDDRTRLADGVTEEIIRRAQLEGISLSATEVRYRLQFARTYPTESQFTKAIGEHHSWAALIQALFPANSRNLSEPDFDPREHRRNRPKRNPLPEDPQPSDYAIEDLWPPDKGFGPASTLDEMRAHYIEQAEMTARFARLDKAREWWLARLERVAGDDGQMTLAEMLDNLDGDE